MKIISELIKRAESYYDEEFDSDDDTIFIEMEYGMVNDLFPNNDFRKFFDAAEEKLSRKYHKRIILKIESLPDMVPFGDIHAEHVGMTLQTTAMIKTITQFKLKLTSILWYCKGCGHQFRRPNTTETIHYPKVCPECGGRNFSIIYEDSTYEDYKLLKLEEPIESRTNKRFIEFNGIVEGYLASPDYDLQAGDVCSIIFTLQPKLNRKNQTLDTILDIWNIKPMNKDEKNSELSPDELSEILDWSLDYNVMDRFVESFPLNIVGYENIKKGLVLQLFSGVNDGEDRMNIHCLLIGDPGLGKSLMLRATSSLSPKVINVNGAGTSLAGLTATAMKNELTGSWELEAGACVLADGGELVIEEFDKMQKYVMLALNEPMEDRTITVSKANIQQTLSADINVLAGANPKNSKFDTHKDIGGQINMPGSLLSRFDLIYAITDEINYENDLSEARKILSKNKPRDDGDRFSLAFMQKYITYAKANIFPELTEDAEEYLATFYARTRGLALVNDESKPITKRELGVIYRLTIAHARLILSDVADRRSAEIATEIYMDSLRTLGLDFTTVGSIQNVLSEKESQIIGFIEEFLSSDEYYSMEDIREEVLDEYDTDKFDRLYEMALENAREKKG